MAFLTITSPATERFVSALCNTLVHSLWQGLILAALTGLIILFTRKQSAAMRYNLLIAALTLFAVGVGVTFALQMHETQPLLTGTIIHSNAVAGGAIQLNFAAPNQSIADILYNYLTENHNTIVTIWFLIICAKSIQLGVGLIGVRRLKNTEVNQVSAEWYNRLQQLAEGLEIKKSVAFLESGLVRVPMVIGAFKPVILIPIGLLTALSAEEVEAILVHELAHIKRCDYLVNLLQSLMEILFFFNPAVLWISQLIKAERENCCDDMALSQSSNKVSYIRALVSCEEYQASVPAYAMAFAGDKNTLVSRVKRMVSNRNSSLNIFEKTALAVCLVVSGLCLSAFGQKANREFITKTVSEVISHIQNENIAKSEKRDLDKYLKKPEAQRQRLDPEAKQINSAVAEVTNETDAGAPDTGKKHVNVNINLDSMHLAPIKLDSMKIHMAPIKVNTKVKLDSMKMHMAPIKVNLNKMTVYQKTNLNVDTDIVSTKSVLDMNLPSGSHYNPPKAYAPNTQLSARHNSTFSARVINSRPTSSPSPDTIKGARIKVQPKFDIADALYNAHVIKDKKNYQLILNNKEMTVNGVKQPENIHQTFLKYYLKKPGDHVDLTVGISN
ncbi:M56 family metallopeptidase [Mucilaginibacter ximonensis]|uniref:M56 family metallopeptidase n=1 Tax=Mucilaginibacter ximonensis TaxID=538021 RepID=A0ABW5YDS5_9SPHI